MRLGRAVALVVSVAAWAGAAHAAWLSGDSHNMHWPQTPDPNDTRLDVVARWTAGGDILMVADDFVAAHSGKVTSVHFWAGMEDGSQPPVAIRHAIYRNIPAADSPTGYDIPGTLLWDGGPASSVEPWLSGDEWFYDPLSGSLTAYSTSLWEFTYDVPASEAPTLEGGERYWFVVEPSMAVQVGVFARTTSLDHWGSEAMYRTFSPDSDWLPLLYTTGHALQDSGINLTFVVVPEPATIGLFALCGLWLIRRKR